MIAVSPVIVAGMGCRMGTITTTDGVEIIYELGVGMGAQAGPSVGYEAGEGGVGGDDGRRPGTT